MSALPHAMLNAAPASDAAAVDDAGKGEDPGVAKPVEERQELIIEPRPGLRGLDVAELWRYRELLYFLVWRDVKVKYKMAMLGVLWAVLVPTMSALIYGVFGMALDLKAPGTEAPYLLWMLAGVVPWMFLQRGFTDGGLSLLNHQSLLTKIYMPRLFIPTGSVGGALFDLALMLIVFTLAAVGFSAAGMFVPTWKIVFVPALLFLSVAAALGTSFLLSALIVLYRDLRFLIQFLSQFGLWLSGVVLPTSELGRYEWMLAYNPYAGIINAWRYCLVGSELRWDFVLGSVISCPILLVVGVFYFRRVERRFADIA